MAEGNRGERDRLVKTLGVLSVLARVVAAAPLILGVFDPWDPPKATGDGAILRVMAPPGEHYKVVWGGAWWQFWLDEGSLVAKVDEGRITEDHHVRPIKKGTYDFTVTKVVRQDGGGFEVASPGWKGDLRAILFVNGGIATCGSAERGPLEVTWQADEGTGSLLRRVACGGYKWAGLVPGHVRVGALVLVPVFFLLSLGLLRGPAMLQAQEEKKRNEVRLASQRKEEQRRRTEALLRRRVAEAKISRMSGAEFERFMASFFRQKGYGVRQTRATGD
jgi:hypothetical protein